MAAAAPSSLCSHHPWPSTRKRTDREPHVNANTLKPAANIPLLHEHEATTLLCSTQNSSVQDPPSPTHFVHDLDSLSHKFNLALRHMHLHQPLAIDIKMPPNDPTTLQTVPRTYEVKAISINQPINQSQTQSRPILETPSPIHFRKKPNPSRPHPI